MESLQMVKKRINSVASTRQITESMRLVSTAKVQRARTRMKRGRPFLEEARFLLDAAVNIQSGERHPYLREREDGCAAVVVIGGDRGLCGGYHMGIGREAAELLNTLGDVRLVTVGTKARDFCRRRWGKSLKASFIGISETPFYEDVKEIASLLLEWYDSGEVSRLYVVYTEFCSMLVQTPKAVRLLPLSRGDGEAGGEIVRSEPDGETFLSMVVPFYVAAFLYGCILESSACEQSARVASMDSAVRNADEMIASLTLALNRARQGAITQEITEIVGGAEAIRD